MPLKSKAQERFLWAKHPKIAQEFEDATPEGAKLPEHVKKMASGGLVEDENEKLNKYLMGQGGLSLNDVNKTNANEDLQMLNVPRRTVDNNTQETVQKTSLPTNTQEVKTGDERIQDSHPGLKAEDLDTYIKRQEGEIDKYGPEQEKAVIDNILKTQGSLGNRLARGGAGLGDAIMGVAGKQSPGFLNSLENREAGQESMLANEIPTLAKMGAENRAEKERLEGMTTSSPLGASYQKAYKEVFKQLFPNMKESELDRMTQNPAIVSKIFPELGPIIEKQVQAEIQKENIDINRQRLIQEKEMGEQGLREKQKEFVAEHPIKSKLGEWISGDLDSDEVLRSVKGKPAIFDAKTKTFKRWK